MVALVAVGLAFVFTFGRSPASPLPNPNGYDDLVQAGQTITGNTVDVADLDHDELRALVTTNAEALRLLRLGLTRDCAVPTDAAIANFGTFTGNLMGLKSLANLLSAEGRLAEMENRWPDAARSYIDSMRLGTAMSRGGLIVNRLVGIACEAMGSIRLVRLISKLDCDQMRPLVSQLEQIDRSTVTWREVIVNENRFARGQLGSYPNPIRLVSDWLHARKVSESAEEKHDLAAAHLRLLTTELALRRYRCDHGNAPVSLQHLLPKYFERMPSDPFSSRPLVYRPTGTNWVLYSIGPDRIDDAGKPVLRTKAGQRMGDLRYDSAW